MIVDFPRPTGSSVILVPPFHTGAVGLVPKTEVYASLIEGEAGIEALIRPYLSSTDNMMRLTCTMYDQPGVVGKLVDAISALDVNIVNEVSSGINHLKHHTVSMLLDWSTSKQFWRRTPSSPGQRRHYRDYHSIFPIMVHRHIRLFESIAERCGEHIVVRRVDALELPMLSLQELDTPPNLARYGAVSVKKADKPHFHVEIELPKALHTKLRLSLGVPEAEQLWYILLSEEETRTLRAFFPRPEIIPKLAHLAFFHLNTPHVFEAILHGLADAGFNLITSIIRQNLEGTNVLEAVLQYQPLDRIPTGSASAVLRGQELCEWAAGLVVKNVAKEDAEVLRKCDLHVGLPLYRVDKGVDKGKDFEGCSVAKLLDNHQGPFQTRTLVKTTPSIKRRWVTYALRGGESERPSVFLSHPKEGCLHAAAIRRRLGDDYRISQPALDDSSAMLEPLSQKIDQFDYFLAVWLPARDDRQISESALMEFTMALTLRKKTFVVYSEDVDASIISRCGPIVKGIEFSHDRFESHTLEVLQGYCSEHFWDEAQFDDAGRGALASDLEFSGQSPTTSFRVATQPNENSAERPSEPASVTKAQFARQFIKDHAVDGFTSAELLSAFRENGIEIYKSYLYSLIQRFEDQRVIHQRDSRYYPVSDMDR
jgi:hypothetical protein